MKVTIDTPADAVDLLRSLVRQTYAWLEMTLEDVTGEQANWQPPGTAHSIGAVYAHTMIAVDVGMNVQLRGRSPLVAERGGRIGLSEMPPAGRDWGQWANSVRVDWKALRSYGRDVQACVERNLQTLSAVELERPVDMTQAGLGWWKALDLYNLHGINHIRIHGGEIACLKGLQGGRGWSHGPVYRD
jgi:hypothetical protein